VSFRVDSPGRPSSSFFCADGEGAPSVGTGAGATIRGTAAGAGVSAGRAATGAGIAVIAGGAAAGAGTTGGDEGLGEGTALGIGTVDMPGLGITGDTGGLGTPGFGTTGELAATGGFGALALGAACGSLGAAAGAPDFFGRFTVGSASDRGSTASWRISRSRLLSSPSADISCSAFSRRALSTRSQLIRLPVGSAVTTSLPTAS
jgi:hypothetical protein